MRITAQRFTLRDFLHPPLPLLAPSDNRGMNSSAMGASRIAYFGRREFRAIGKRHWKSGCLRELRCIIPLDCSRIPAGFAAANRHREPELTPRTRVFSFRPAFQRRLMRAVIHSPESFRYAAAACQKLCGHDPQCTAEEGTGKRIRTDVTPIQESERIGETILSSNNVSGYWPLNCSAVRVKKRADSFHTYVYARCHNSYLINLLRSMSVN